MARTKPISSVRASTVPAAKRGGLSTKAARGSSAIGAKLSAAIQKKYKEIRASRPNITKGITVDELMNFYFLPEIKHELNKASISQTGNKRILCHRVAAWINEGRKLTKKQTYRPAGQAPKPKSKKGRTAKAGPMVRTVDTTGLTAAPQITPVQSIAVSPAPTPTPSQIKTTTPRKPVSAGTGSSSQRQSGTNHRHEHKWQYEDKSKANGPWFDYDATASDLVEDAYIDWKKDPFVDVRAVKSGEWEYMVDFNQMEQQNVQHTAHTRRKVRRVTKDNQLADAEAAEIRQRVLQQRQAAAGRK